MSKSKENLFYNEHKRFIYEELLRLVQLNSDDEEKFIVAADLKPDYLLMKQSSHKEDRFKYKEQFRAYDDVIEELNLIQYKAEDLLPTDYRKEKQIGANKLLIVKDDIKLRKVKSFLKKNKKIEVQPEPPVEDEGILWLYTNGTLSSRP